MISRKSESESQNNILKPVVIKIHLSNHLFFGVCRRCGSSPKDYYYVGNYEYISPQDVINQFNKYKYYMNRLCYDFYLDSFPKNYYGITFLSHPITYHKFSPRQHKNRWKDVDDVQEFLSCQCGHTSWAFRDRASKNRPEIFHRKSRNTFPKKFKSY